MGSSVRLYTVFGLWITFGRKIAYNNHNPNEKIVFWGKLVQEFTLIFAALFSLGGTYAG